jgi:hypothetical protein
LLVIDGRPQINSASDAKAYQAEMREIIKDINQNTNILINVPEEIRYAQQDYHKFDVENSNGTIRNIGCPATSLATTVSYNNCIYTPEDVPWSNGVGVLWPTDICNNIKNLTIEESYSIVSESLINKKVCVMLVNNKGSTHFVTVIGNVQGSDINNLSFDDLVIIDSWGGIQKDLKDTNYTQWSDGGCRVITTK